MNDAVQTVEEGHAADSEVAAVGQDSKVDPKHVYRFKRAVYGNEAVFTNDEGDNLTRTGDQLLENLDPVSTADFQSIPIIEHVRALIAMGKKPRHLNYVDGFRKHFLFRFVKVFPGAAVYLKNDAGRGLRLERDALLGHLESRDSEHFRSFMPEIEHLKALEAIDQHYRFKFKKTIPPDEAIYTSPSGEIRLKADIIHGLIESGLEIPIPIAEHNRALEDMGRWFFYQGTSTKSRTDESLVAVFKRANGAILKIPKSALAGHFNNSNSAMLRCITKTDYLKAVHELGIEFEALNVSDIEHLKTLFERAGVQLSHKGQNVSSETEYEVLHRFGHTLDAKGISGQDGLDFLHDLGVPYRAIV